MNLRPDYLLSSMIFAYLAIGQVPSSSISADITLALTPAYGHAAPASQVAVELDVQSVSHSAGAFSLILTYNPAVLKIVAIVPSAASRFAGNLFADPATFSSGSTRVVGFQTNNPGSSPSPTALIAVVFDVVGSNASSSPLTLAAEKFVDGWWRELSIETQTSLLTVSDADGDNDGLPDWWESLHFGSSQEALAALDSDGDGFSNLKEFLMKTNPRNAMSGLFSKPVVQAGNSFVFDVSTQAGVLYQVETSPTLGAGSWVGSGPPFWGNGGDVRVIDSDVLNAPSIERRFYRVKVLTP